jgi:hypothetical protein
MGDLAVRVFITSPFLNVLIRLIAIRYPLER